MGRLSLGRKIATTARDVALARVATTDDLWQAMYAHPIVLIVPNATQRFGYV